ncbi:MAG: pilus assembly protein [Anaerolineae bacterium]|nr:pilus assembly protein [Anaerolineae bacterium]
MANKLQPFNAKLRRFRAALDGRSRRGQSLVELTLTLPILLLLLFGMIEIGWYANNYLVLLDASREAGRYGATGDPVQQWQIGLSNEPFRHDCCVGDQCYDELFAHLRNPRPEMEEYYQAVQDYLNNPSGDEDIKARLRAAKDSPLRYFDGVACRVLYNLSPLEFDWTRDEVVVSVFSYVPPYTAGWYLPPEFPARSSSWPFTRIAPTYPISGGRMPIERNQCDRDAYGSAESVIEHIGYTLTAVGNDECTPSADYPANPEKFCGECDPASNESCANHRRSDGCYGSEWDPGEIEERLYEFEGEGLAGGLVLVEVFWWHEQLLGLPFVSSLANPMEIYVWVMFPVSAAEPTPTGNR